MFYDFTFTCLELLYYYAMALKWVKKLRKTF